MDVTSLAWSPSGDQLASCSIDTTVVVWDTLRLVAVHTLRGHTSWVKGVAWDPAGTLLASQADDPSLIIWNLRTMTMQALSHACASMLAPQWTAPCHAWFMPSCVLFACRARHSAPLWDGRG
jgi:WD40 repeat protein